MTIGLLKKLIEDNNISSIHYRLMCNGLPDEKLCIYEDEELFWHVYYSERGKRSNEIIFTNESEACNYFWQKISRYGSGSKNSS